MIDEDLLLSSYKEQYRDAVEELAAIRIMSEEDACRRYNVDFKSEIETILIEEIESLEALIAQAPDEYADEFNN